MYIVKYELLMPMCNIGCLITGTNGYTSSTQSSQEVPGSVQQARGSRHGRITGGNSREGPAEQPAKGHGKTPGGNIYL